MNKAKYYIKTEEAETIFYDKMPKDVHITDAVMSYYTKYPQGSCWVRVKTKLYKLMSVKTELQVVK
tara:strand:- start:2048 stop:2245 length:198 start_codon:yes stop_codon:yes gene_type:complete